MNKESALGGTHAFMRIQRIHERVYPENEALHFLKDQANSL